MDGTGEVRLEDEGCGFVFVFSETPNFVLKPSFFVLFVLLGIKLGFLASGQDENLSFRTCRGQWLS